MKRRDFLKAFSATTTIAAAHSLANIVEAQPVIKTFEHSIILPGDKDFNVDWVFDDIALYEHKYDGGSQFNFGVVIPDSFVNELNILSGNDSIRFGFKLQEDYFLIHSYTPGSSDLPFPPHYQNFLENNIFVASTKDISLSGECRDGFLGLEITNATIAW